MEAHPASKQNDCSRKEGISGVKAVDVVAEADRGSRVNLPVWESEPVRFGLSESLRPG